jgi:hypothetical protein
MKASKLIAELYEAVRHNGDLEVFTEGEDFYHGETNDVWLSVDRGRIYITDATREENERAREENKRRRLEEEALERGEPGPHQRELEKQYPGLLP